MEGQEIPHDFIITIDGTEVFSAPIGGPEDHLASSENISLSRAEIDERMTSPPIPVQAGPHEVGFTFVGQPTEEQNVWQPILRDAESGEGCGDSMMWCWPAISGAFERAKLPHRRKTTVSGLSDTTPMTRSVNVSQPCFR